MANDTPLKVCRKCGESRPLDDFHRHSSTRDKLQPWCKTCVRERGQARRAADPEENRARCRAWADANRDHKLAMGRLYYQRNKEKFRQDGARRYLDNKQRVQERCRQYYQRNRDALLASMREWRIANADHLRQSKHSYYMAHAAEISIKTRLYRRRNIDAYRAISLRGKALRRGAVGAERFTRAEIWQRDGGRCHICRKLCDPNDWHLDHLVPVSLGGPHSRANVAVSHPSCNIRRSNRGPAQLRLLD